MWQDEILDEIHQIREEHAESLDISENGVGRIHEFCLPRISSNAELIFTPMSID